MSVSATHAALRLAQGAGRLVRRADDRGVVAFLDNRMVKARYAGFLQRSLPPFWPTTDRELVLGALRRLDESAPPPLPVADPARRGLTGSVVTGAAAARPDADGAEHPRPAADGPGPASGARTAVTRGEGWGEQDDEELRDGAELGLSMADLVRQSGRSAEAVRARLEGLGLGVPE